MFKKLLFAIFFFLIIPISLAYSWSASGSFDCDGCCVEYKQFTYKSTITNTGEDNLFINAGKLIDYSGNKFSTKGDVDSYGWSVAPGEDITFSYSGRLPNSDSGSRLYYKHCLYIGGYWTGSWSCPSNYASKTVALKSNFKCYTDANCPSEEYCHINNECKASDCLPIEQGKCGYISNHKWIDYECCENINCQDSETCMDNHCVSISCECGHISEHGCIHYECCENTACKSNEQCINHVCKEPNCGYCEYVINHRCTKYECCEDTACKSNEQCVNHQCQKLNCKYGEYISEHNCLKYQCMSNEDCPLDNECRNHNCLRPQCTSDEIIKHHNCKSLGFTPFGYVKENRYVSYFSKESYRDYKVFYIAFFISILIIFVSLIYLIKKKKLSNVYAKKIKKEELKKTKKEIKKIKFCNKCGAKLKKEMKFCKKCGVRTS